MERDRSVRRLTALEQSASTARVLNLLSVHRKLGNDPDLAKAPFFLNRVLDRSIILKHRLRPHEYALFKTPKPNATKILIPFDTADLRAGARAIFIGQQDFDGAMENVFGADLRAGSQDRRVLDLIDDLPSLDPFLLREHLRQNELQPDRAYFNLSDGDVQRMFDFVREQIIALVQLSSDQQAGVQAHASRLVEKLLLNAPDAGFEPLRATLRLSDQEYRDGIFSWRGFLYYKWVLSEISKPLGQVIKEIHSIAGRGPRDPDASEYLPGGKARIQQSIAMTVGQVSVMLGRYDNAYRALTVESKPNAFRDFLLQAPSMFSSLGEQLGALQHVVSFWRYRFPEGRPRVITPTDLMDLFLDFEDSMAHSEAAERSPAG